MMNTSKSNKEFWSINGRDILYFPIEIPKGISVIQMLDDIFVKYNKLLAKVSNDNSNNINSVVKKDVSIICKDIIDSIKLFITGDIIRAFDKFSKMMEHYLNDLPYKYVETNKLFFRMRAEFDIKEKNQFYHLPSSMRSKCSSERYSIAGYPCFYIGYSKSDCFVEISKNGSMIGLSLKEEQSIPVLDLTFYEDQLNDRNIVSFVKTWPIIVACNLVFPRVDTVNAKFREEYIIPQMLTAYLRHNNKFKGICYYSVRNENLKCDGVDEDDYRNLVLFPDIKDREEYDTNLMDAFEWFTPFNVGERKDS